MILHMWCMVYRVMVYEQRVCVRERMSSYIYKCCVLKCSYIYFTIYIYFLCLGTCLYLDAEIPGLHIVTAVLRCVVLLIDAHTLAEALLLEK